MSGPTPQKAWNSTPTKAGGNTGRQANMGKEPRRSTRCSICDAFPSWEVPGTKGKQRRCEAHRDR